MQLPHRDRHASQNLSIIQVLFKNAKVELKLFLRHFRAQKSTAAIEGKYKYSHWLYICRRSLASYLSLN